MSLWDRKRDTSIRKIAHLHRVSTMLTKRCLQLLGHILCMDTSRLPRKLLVCAPSQGRRSMGGQKLRWNDLVQRDLRNCHLEEDWRTVAQNRMSGGARSGLLHRTLTPERKRRRKTARMNRNVVMKQGNRHLTLLYCAMSKVVVSLL